MKGISPLFLNCYELTPISLINERWLYRHHVTKYVRHGSLFLWEKPRLHITCKFYHSPLKPFQIILSIFITVITITHSTTSANNSKPRLYSNGASTLALLSCYSFVKSSLLERMRGIAVIKWVAWARSLVVTSIPASWVEYIVALQQLM